MRKTRTRKSKQQPGCQVHLPDPRDGPGDVFTFQFSVLSSHSLVPPYPGVLPSILRFASGPASSTRTPKVVRSKLNGFPESTHGIAPLSGRGHWCWPNPGRRACGACPGLEDSAPLGPLRAERIWYRGSPSRWDSLGPLRAVTNPCSRRAPSHRKQPRLFRKSSMDPRASRKRAPQGTRPMAFPDASWPDARFGETSALKIAERVRLPKERGTPRRGEITQPRASAARRAALGRRTVSTRTPKVVRSTTERLFGIDPWDRAAFRARSLV
ncbi:MAG: hypothetical protein PWP23_3332, partial [Candidatus Sumerlaeota bacterium]|nr:hypothetical protein [Candidatus Sumerlaeota bacterium]